MNALLIMQGNETGYVSNRKNNIGPKTLLQNGTLKNLVNLQRQMKKQFLPDSLPDSLPETKSYYSS